MKLKSLLILIACAALTTISLLLLPAASWTPLHAQSATTSALPAQPFSQCGAIDSLIAVNPATPGASQTVSATTPTSIAIVPTVVNPTVAPAENAAGSADGGDEALTTYRDTAQKFRIDYPHSWSQASAFLSGVCFTGRDSSIAVQFVSRAAPNDLLAYVKADKANIQSKLAGYRQVYLKPSADIPGAVILGYEWDAGKSAVTEKPVHARTDRYYLTDASGRFVIVSETEPINQFDPDGVRDTALTYQSVK